MQRARHPAAPQNRQDHPDLHASASCLRADAAAQKPGSLNLNYRHIGLTETQPGRFFFSHLKGKSRPDPCPVSNLTAGTKSPHHIARTNLNLKPNTNSLPMPQLSAQPKLRHISRTNPQLHHNLKVNLNHCLHSHFNSPSVKSCSLIWPAFIGGCQSPGLLLLGPSVSMLSQSCQRTGSPYQKKSQEAQLSQTGIASNAPPNKASVSPVMRADPVSIRKSVAAVANDAAEDNDSRSNICGSGPCIACFTK